MKLITLELGDVATYLEREFGSLTKCGSGACEFTAPPVGIPFEVLEALETEPHPAEESRNAEFGLTKDACIPPGTYKGLRYPGIMVGTSSHSVSIIGSKKHGTKDVSGRMVNGTIDWRGVRKIRD